MSSSRAGSGPGSDVAANEAICCGRDLMPGQDGIPARGRRERGFERELARTGAAFVEGSHGAAPTVGSHRAFGVGQLDLNEFFGFGESGGRNFRTRPRSPCRTRAARRAAGCLRSGLGCGEWLLPKVPRTWCPEISCAIWTCNLRTGLDVAGAVGLCRVETLAREQAAVVRGVSGLMVQKICRSPSIASAFLER